MYQRFSVIFGPFYNYVFLNNNYGIDKIQVLDSLALFFIKIEKETKVYWVFMLIVFDISKWLRITAAEHSQLKPISAVYWLLKLALNYKAPITFLFASDGSKPDFKWLLRPTGCLDSFARLDWKFPDCRSLRLSVQEDMSFPQFSMYALGLVLSLCWTVFAFSEIGKWR